MAKAGLGAAFVLPLLLLGAPAKPAAKRVSAPPSANAVQPAPRSAYARKTHRPLIATGENSFLSSWDVAAVRDSGLVFVPDTAWTLNPADRNRILGGPLSISPPAFAEVDAGTECRVRYLVLAVPVPSLTQLSLDSAAILLAAEDLTSELAEGSDSFGMVVSQSPQPGVLMISAGSVLPSPHGAVRLSLVASRAPQALPDLVDLRPDSALAKLKRLGISARLLYRDTTANHAIAETQPEAGALVAPGTTVVLAVGEALPFWVRMRFLIRLLVVVLAAFALAYLVVRERLALGRFLLGLLRRGTQSDYPKLVAPLEKFLERLAPPEPVYEDEEERKKNESQSPAEGPASPREAAGEEPEFGGVKYDSPEGSEAQARERALAEPQPIEPTPRPETPVGPLDAVVAAYNRSLSLALFEAFLKEHKAEPVDLVRPAPSAESALAGAPVTLALTDTGRFLLVRSGPKYLLFPAFDLPNGWFDDIQRCFDCTIGEGLPGTPRFVLKVLQAGICVRAGIKWKLESKGRLAIVG